MNWWLLFMIARLRTYYLHLRCVDLVRQSFDASPKIKVVGYSGLTVEFCRAIGAQVIVRSLRVLFRILNTNSVWHSSTACPEIESMALITAEEHTFFSLPLRCVKLPPWR
jgi:pantetheine-phosphate adenylyltransferase